MTLRPCPPVDAMASAQIASMRVLLVEDADADAVLVTELLTARARGDISVERVSRSAEAVNRLETEKFDAILLDLSLPDSQGLETLRRIVRTLPTAPIIILSGLADEDMAAMAVRDGAQDYLIKGRIDGVGLARSMRYAVERRSIERRLREREEHFRALVEHSYDSIAVLANDGAIVYASPSTSRVLGYSATEIVGRPAQSFVEPSSQSTYRKSFDESLQKPGEAVPVRAPVRRRDGSLRHLEGVFVNLLAHPSVRGVVNNAHDITEQRQAERLFESALDVSPNGILLINEANSVVIANRHAGKIFGYRQSEFIGKPVDALLKIERVTAAAGARTVGNEATWERGDIVGRHADGHKLNLQIGSAPIAQGGSTYLLISIVDITEMKRVQAEVARVAARLQALMNKANDGIAIVSVDGVIGEVNDRLCEILGRPAAEIIGRPIYEFSPPSAEFSSKKFADMIREQGGLSPGIPVQRPDGRVVYIDFSASIVELENEQVVISIGRDVTAQKLLEAQLRQSQKMEAIGQLAGGIAHDFNNMLTAIFGYVDLLEEQLSRGTQPHQDLQEIRAAANRAAGLTRQLLAFSRRQVLQPDVISLNTVIGGLKAMLQPLLHEGIELRITLAPALGNVLADAGQIEQVLMNLAVNSRDAMPTGGRLTIETGNVSLGEEYGDKRGVLPPGRYVTLVVTDTGEGMDEATKSRMFEPFFTTKKVGRGTGLGLATVYGIIRQTGGQIWAYSEPGQGTSFKIFLPRVDAAASQARMPEPTLVENGSETILLVDDDAVLRRLCRTLLERHGYTVIEAGDPGSAMEVAWHHPGPIHLLVSDVVMPGGDGFELSARMTREFPGLRVLHTSGFAIEVLGERGLAGVSHAFLEKPFTPKALSLMVRQVLDATTD